MTEILVLRVGTFFDFRGICFAIYNSFSHSKCYVTPHWISWFLLWFILLRSMELQSTVKISSCFLKLTLGNKGGMFITWKSLRRINTCQICIFTISVNRFYFSLSHVVFFLFSMQIFWVHNLIEIWCFLEIIYDAAKLIHNEWNH